jgi:hypothetical protein
MRGLIVLSGIVVAPGLPSLAGNVHLSCRRRKAPKAR